MKRCDEEDLIDFCLRQRVDFDPVAWLTYPHPSRQELAAVALFLARVAWYGHPHELAQVAEQLQPGCAGNLATLVQQTGFDCSRFSNRLRTRLSHAATLS
ncbi:MAG: hypothetical protein HQL58_08355 [Magnetococcales bacterium]|nr:hypothetical protein [Magnetococcales bacterium]